MAWPFTRLTTYVANTTPVIKAFDLNAIQDAIGAIFGGTLSFKNLLIDGAGNAAASLAAGVVAAITGGAFEADGATGDMNPAIVMSATPATRKLWAKLKISTIYARIYVGTGVEIAINAAWNSGTSQWDFDNAGLSAVRLKLTYSGTYGFQVSYNAGGVSFADGSWVDSINVANSDSSFTAKGSVNTGANLVASSGHATVGEMKIGTAMPTPACALGTVYKDLVPIGWGRFVVAGGVISMSSGVNIKSAVRNGTGDFTITFGTAPPLPGFHGVAFALAYNSPDVTFWSSTDAEGGTGNMIVNLKSRSVGTTPASVDASFFLVAFCG